MSAQEDVIATYRQATTKRKLNTQEYFATARRYSSAGFALGLFGALAIAYRFDLIPEGFGGQTLFGAALLVAAVVGATVADLLLTASVVKQDAG